MTQCYADGNQNPRNGLKNPPIILCENVCWVLESWKAALHFAASGNLMFQTDLGYEFFSKILNEG